MPIDQEGQAGNPDGRVILGQRIEGSLLSLRARSLWGLRTGDNPQFRRFFWELPRIDARWKRIQCSVSTAVAFGGREEILLWENDEGRLRQLSRGRIGQHPGNGRMGTRGRRRTLSGRLPVTRYTGEIFAELRRQPYGLLNPSYSQRYGRSFRATSFTRLCA